MAVNRGKKFEEVIHKCFLEVPNTSVIRLPDPVQGYLGIRNHCDFIVYHYPHEYHIECKSIHGNTFPLSNITKNQWDGMLEKSQINGIYAGVIVWWVDKDVTKFIPIELLVYLKDIKKLKSIRYDYEPFDSRSLVIDTFDFIELKGKKKRVFFNYDMAKFFSKFFLEVKAHE